MTASASLPIERGSVAAATNAPPPELLIAGNPNSGKTTVFNALTGARAKVGNYPGVTVDRRAARLTLPGGRPVEVVDLPGTYSLSARSPEEQIAVDAVLGYHQRAADAVVVVMDATALARGLYLALQVIETGVPTVLALNMMDEARAGGLDIDADALGGALGVEAVAIVASRGRGLDRLLAAAERALSEGRRPSPFSAHLGPETRADVDRVARSCAAAFEPDTPAAREAWARWAILSIGDDELEDVPAQVRRAVADVRARAEAQGRDLDLELVSARYAQIDRLMEAHVRGGTTGETHRWTRRVDAVLLHPALGFAVFAAVMAIVFEALFAWSDPAIGLVEGGIAAVQGLAAGVLPEGPVRGLAVDGVIAGVGNVVVFVPQIALLFLFIGVLEDSGYLARVAFVIDRLMGGIGLHGKAFVPLLSGFACAVPAVMATRTIESRRDRLLTMLVVPLASCSARLPVYVLVTAAIFDPDATVLGFLSTGASVLFAMYFLSVGAALFAAFVLRRTILRGHRPPLVLELPPYRMPVARNILLSTWTRVRAFLVEAGTIILALTVVLWALLSYPRSADIEGRYAGLRADVEAAALLETERDVRLAELDAREAGEQLEHSVAGRFGHAIEPALRPFGQDWRIGIGLLGAFAAREVFVSTLGVVFGIGEVDEESEPLRQMLRDATWPDGSPLVTPLSGVALMVFFVLACQCMSTIAVVRRESGSWRWPLFMLAYMTALAYGAATATYQVGRALGWGVG